MGSEQLAVGKSIQALSVAAWIRGSPQKIYSQSICFFLLYFPKTAFLLIRLLLGLSHRHSGKALLHPSSSTSISSILVQNSLLCFPHPKWQIPQPCLLSPPHLHILSSGSMPQPKELVQTVKLLMTQHGIDLRTMGWKSPWPTSRSIRCIYISQIVPSSQNAVN